ncbi:MAG: ribokinase [Christensenella sp.]|uniref:ribokinase n=1 Tax=Christensenella sp. TaxID=1935934 RepID=UPI002B1FBECE|nr:ribokinase [Christensenella sp.]MEA5002858.1 ribokinase [Christensenella sp.]
MKVLNFGSLNVDYVYDVPHFVTPGETITSLGRNIFAGGKGLNQSIATKKAGANVYHAGTVGSDGDPLLEALQQAGVNHDFVLQREDAPSGHTVIQVDPNGQNCIIVFGGTNRQIPKEQMDETLTHFEAGDFLLLQNELNDISYLIDKAYEKGMNIVLNPSPIDPSINDLPLEKVKYFIVNEIEGAQIAGTDVIDNIIPAIAKKYPHANILMTLGSEGSRYYDGDKTYTQGIFPVKAVDTTAAGDTFLGYFVYGVSNGLSIEDTLRLAARASSITVSKKGAAGSIPTLDMVLAQEK